MMVSLEPENTGERTGAEVVQVYPGDRTGPVITPDQEPSAFTKVRLARVASPSSEDRAPGRVAESRTHC